MSNLGAGDLLEHVSIHATAQNDDMSCGGSGGQDTHSAAVGRPDPWPGTPSEIPCGCSVSLCGLVILVQRNHLQEYNTSATSFDSHTRQHLHHFSHRIMTAYSSVITIQQSPQKHDANADGTPLSGGDEQVQLHHIHSD